MLDVFRKAANTWIVKLLFALLALLFVFWGIGNRKFDLGTAPAIEVGGTSFSAADVMRELKHDVDALQLPAGARITLEEARKTRLLDIVIERLVTRSLVDEAGRSLGLVASDDAIRAQLEADPALRNERGELDVDRLLRRYGMTEATFMRMARDDLVRSQLAATVFSSVTAPDVLVEPLVKSHQEQRVAVQVTVKDDQVPAPPAPDAAALEDYYKANTPRFMAPEYRQLTVLLLRPADVAAAIEIPDETIEAAYQQRRDEFSTPERRQTAQVVLTDEATALKAGKLIAEGKSLAAIAAALGSQVIDLGNIEKGELPEGLAASVFSQAKGVIAPPVKSPLGWHVVQVTAITPAQERSLADVRSQVEQDIRRERTDDMLIDLSNRVQDAFAGGATLEEAAERLKLKVVKFPAVDAQGRGPDGKPVADLPKTDTFLDVAFHADTTSESQVTENPGDGYFVVRVDTITPPAPRPLAEVKPDIVKAWTTEKRHAAAKERAEEASRQLAAGKAPALVARAVGGQTGTIPPFTRDHADGTGMTPSLVSAMFAKAPGQVAVDAVQDGWMAARLDSIVPFDTKAHAEAIQAGRRAIAQSITGDVVDQYIAALNAKYGVKVDRSQLTHEE